MRQHQHTTSRGEATTITDVGRWTQVLAHFHARIASLFARPEPRRRALAYVQGLLSSIPRKNGWQLAEHAREATPYGMQRLLADAVWDADLVRNEVRNYVLEHLGHPHVTLVIDETSFPKRGTKSVGVQKQYCGTTGPCVTHNSLLVRKFEGKMRRERGTQSQLLWEVETGEPYLRYGDRLFFLKWGMCHDPS